MLQKKERLITSLRPSNTLRFEILEMEFGFSSGPFFKVPNGSTWSILLGVVYFAFKIHCIFKTFFALHLLDLNYNLKVMSDNILP